jgi:RNA-dependent RNA polymerase
VFYHSDKALGQLFRAIDVEIADSFSEDKLPPGLEVGPAFISKKLRPLVQKEILSMQLNRRLVNEKLVDWFAEYVAELTHIAHAHSLSTDATVRLSEQELVLGTINQKSAQPRNRKEKVARLKLHMRNLVKLTSYNFGEPKMTATKEELRLGLQMAWEAWNFSITQADVFGGPSFGLIALGHILKTLKLISTKNETLNIIEPDLFEGGILEMGNGESWD